MNGEGSEGKTPKEGGGITLEDIMKELREMKNEMKKRMDNIENRIDKIENRIEKIEKEMDLRFTEMEHKINDQRRFIDTFVKSRGSEEEDWEFDPIPGGISGPTFDPTGRYYLGL